MRKILSLILLLIAFHHTRAQTCTINASTTTVCIGNTVTLSLTITGGTAASVTWNMGDLSTSTLPVVVHTYMTTGTYTPTATINLAGGGTCNATGPTIKVVHLPVAKFSMLSPDTICFKNNQLCIKDESVPGLSQAPLSQRVFQLNNGYIQIDNAPLSTNICYQNTTDFFGRLYTIVLEVTDTNGCVSRMEKKDSVFLLPRNQPISFSTLVNYRCDSTPVTFINTSTIPLSQVKNFRWDFGDGTVDISNTRWNNFVKYYKVQGIFDPRLIVEDRNGCLDTFLMLSGASHYRVDSTIRVTSNVKIEDSLYRRCYSKQKWTFTNLTQGDNKRWYIIKDGKVIDSMLFVSSLDDYSFPNCGDYTVRLVGKWANCEFTKDTTLSIFGPNAIIENDTMKVVNRNQCESFDTVFFKNPVPYLSCHNNNQSMQWLWNFGDLSAPACTTNTRLGINVGLNCNFSRDSFNIKHRYPEGQQNCYVTSLYMIDTVSGCFDGDTVSVSLKLPNAGWDSTANPVRRGLFYEGLPCLNTPLTFWFTELVPECGYERGWINWDTACGQWELLDTTRIVDQMMHIYQDYCDSSGNVVVGLVLRNGKDRNGNYCYDTAYYPFFHFIKKKPAFKFEKLNNCPPYLVKLQLLDTVQPDLEYVNWTLGRVVTGGSSIVLRDTSQQMNGDSVIGSQTFLLPSNGSYEIFIGMKDIDGCLSGFRQFISIGFKMEAGVTKEVQCAGVPFQIFDQIRYYDPFQFDVTQPRAYWNEPDRIAANKERMWWDIGDGKGFSRQGPDLFVNYTKPGTYTIKLVAKDSANCYDTLVLQDLFTIVKPIAKIWTADSVLLCAPQIVGFRDSSAFFDSTDMVDPNPPDQILDWRWEFDDFKAPSILQNPAHDFTSNGRFNIQLIINTAFGCSDTAIYPIHIRGPQPSFVIPDSVGCNPFEVTFVNTTGEQLINWVWYFGDSANSVRSIQTDSSVTFKYTKPGIYNVRLLGTDTIFNTTTGNMRTCSVIFPDTNTNIPWRRVFVQPTPEMDILSKDTICPGVELVFTANGDPLYTIYNWFFTPTDSITTNRPDSTSSFTFNTPGTYQVKLIPLANVPLECTDTAEKEIFVQEVVADFDIDVNKAPLYQMANKSKFATRYEWFDKKGQPFGNPFSTLLNPTYKFEGDSFAFDICLVAFNADDCWDSTCKMVYYFSQLKIPNVFTPGNNDDFNDAFDIDIDGEKFYELKIYNRWGGLVFESQKDGFGNDGTNWNGKIMNTGAECAVGVYYYIFDYQMMNEEKKKSVNGTITLLR